MKTALQSLRILFVLTVLTGVVYPLAVAVIAKLAFPTQANGSLLTRNGKLIGSSLMAQKFEGEKYFWPRPSAGDYATVASGASNKGPTSIDLVKAIQERRSRFGEKAPVDLLTASGSGLDPHVSPEAARHQLARVAVARQLDPKRLEALVDQCVEGPQWGLFGESRVNVLALNLRLDEIK